MSKQEARELLKKYREGTCTPDEAIIVEEWYAKLASAERLPAGDPSYDSLYQKGLKSLLEETGDTQKMHFQTRIRLRRWIPYAAAILILSGISFWFMGNGRFTQPEPSLETIQPGGHRATLTLSTGETLVLSEEQEGIVIGPRIQYADGSEVVVDDIAMSTPSAGVPTDGLAPEQMMRLSTPRGGTYQVVLPDGSKVWLNAGTTLKYPDRFGSDQRTVYLSGEAFFEVCPDSGRPFKVVSDGQTIEVLGTRFNISTYYDADEIRTTLVEGSVRVSANGNSRSGVTLVPGEQATLRGNNIEVQTTNINNAIAWKSGKFSFDGKTFEQIMGEVSRWYDLKVTYKNEVPRERLVGDAYRHDQLSTVLDMLKVLEIKYTLDVDEKELIIL